MLDVVEQVTLQTVAVPETPVPVSPAPAPEAAPAGGALTVRLSALYEFWPEPVRQEIAQSNLQNASLVLPMNRLDSAMKTGRVVFTWGKLMRWLDVSSATAASPHGATSLELPLKVMVPLFMAQRPASVAQKKIEIGELIPNLFAAPVKPSGQIAPVPAPAPKVVSPTPVVAAAPANVLGEIFGQPAKSEWSPEEITEKINDLPGVAASLIVKGNGLLVAGKLPPHLKSEVMALSLPQVFGRLAQYTGEIQMGPLTTVTLLTGQTRFAIFRIGTFYLVVLGKPGAALPDVLLQRIAAELAKRSQ